MANIKIYDVVAAVEKDEASFRRQIQNLAKSKWEIFDLHLKASMTLIASFCEGEKRTMILKINLK